MSSLVNLNVQFYWRLNKTCAFGDGVGLVIVCANARRYGYVKSRGPPVSVSFWKLSFPSWELITPPHELMCSVQKTARPLIFSGHWSITLLHSDEDVITITVFCLGWKLLRVRYRFWLRVNSMLPRSKCLPVVLLLVPTNSLTCV